MNYLAHAYLSFEHPGILVGNMISDFVKGRKKFDYGADIQKGIFLHRAIDEFTDTHAVTRQAKSYFRNAYGLYSAAFVDIVYDHFLANDTAEFEEGSLMEFSQRTYDILMRHLPEMPERFQHMLPFMKKQNWLYNYQFREGLRNSFGGLVRRAAYLDESDTAFRLFEKHYEDLMRCYMEFFPELKQFSHQTFESLINREIF